VEEKSKMKGALFALLGAAAVAVGAGEHVVSLGDADFDDHVAKYKYVLAEFFAPWCGHCKSLAPEYEKAAEHFSGVEVEGGLSIVAVDATEAKDLAAKFEVQGFPTLKFLVNGEATDYQGGRTKDEIVAWLNKKTGPPALTIEDAESFQKFTESESVKVFGYFSSLESDAAKEFIAAAEVNDDAPFAYSTVVSGGLEADSVVVLRDFEGEEAEVKCETLTKDEINKCVSDNSLPLIVPFSQENAPKIFGGAITQHLLVFLDNESDDAKTVLGHVQPVATENKGDYVFVSVDKSDDRILEFFGIAEEDLPTARIVEMLDSGMKKFSIEEAVSTESLKSFVAAHKAGELKQALKSEEDIADEEQPKDGNVWVLVGKNHDRIALDGTKNVLVEYYAPWCGHCKKLAPEYEKVAEHYKEDGDVIIAKMDSTANEVESVSVQGFPTLQFYPKGVTDADEAVDFDGSRDEEGIKTFIEANRK